MYSNKLNPTPHKHHRRTTAQGSPTGGASLGRGEAGEHLTDLVVASGSHLVEVLGVCVVSGENKILYAKREVEHLVDAVAGI
jgi:hypothetical protein